MAESALFELRQEDLHTYWPFLMRGLGEIKRKIKPNWLPEDMYAAIRNGAVNCLVGSLHELPKGYIIYSKQIRPFNFRPELFVWVYWCVPLKEWPDQEAMLQLGRDAWQYIVNVTKTQYGSDQIAWVTTPRRAAGFERRWGHKPTWVTMTVKV